MFREVTKQTTRPNHYVCPSCHLYLLAWDPPTQTVEMFHKIGLWADLWSGHVRMICQYCLGATEVLPEELVNLLRQRFGLGTPLFESRRARV
ncbi:MAG TPA: hypothetical protein VGW35_07710 [Methylomirabilota bacterium]|jgi:hypothetical protein|nr:hypothetical protein [Methylomirabilota bacterium]